MTGNDDPRVAAAFTLLVEAVHALSGRGRSTTAAGVNSEIQRIAVERFSVQDLGFARFRDFLEAAADAGLVELTHPAPGSKLDIVVSPADRAADSTAVAKPEPRPTPVDSVVWRAFVDPDASMRRVVDSATGHVHLYKRLASPLDTPATEALRAAVHSDHSGRYVDIEPIAEETQLQWAREFVSSISEADAAAVLRSALDQGEALRAFMSAARGFGSVQSRWASFRTTRVRSVIEDWARERNIALRINRPPNRTEPRVDRRLTEVPVSSTDRETVLRALARMTLPELLELRVPARLLLDGDRE